MLFLCRPGSMTHMTSNWRTSYHSSLISQAFQMSEAYLMGCDNRIFSHYTSAFDTFRPQCKTAVDQLLRFYSNYSIPSRESITLPCFSIELHVYQLHLLVIYQRSIVKSFYTESLHWCTYQIHTLLSNLRSRKLFFVTSVIDHGYWHQ